MISTDIDESFPNNTEQLFSYFCIGFFNLSICDKDLGSIQFYSVKFFCITKESFVSFFLYIVEDLLDTGFVFSVGLPADFSLYFLLIFQYAFLFLPEQVSEICDEFLNAVILHTHTDRIDDHTGGQRAYFF